ncbi:hypothetical protein DPMN_161038 [Dreissena polymorpha]|uniref:Uncharacterized protein n=1 Tax=Dreissena polymorpha TaxID=45954 RepID=A0A9D4IQQ6_DREPO|nr:hypothetical protein DPMN_161038 [Dreissena polymorpha]
MTIKKNTIKLLKHQNCGNIFRLLKSTAKAEQTYFAICGGKAKRVDATSAVEAEYLALRVKRRRAVGQYQLSEGLSVLRHRWGSCSLSEQRDHRFSGIAGDRA